MIEVTQDPIAPATLLEAFSRGRVTTGAIVSFSGLTRGGDAAAPVTLLTLDAYPGFTEKVVSPLHAGSNNGAI